MFLIDVNGPTWTKAWAPVVAPPQILWLWVGKWISQPKSRKKIHQLRSHHSVSSFFWRGGCGKCNPHPKHTPADTTLSCVWNDFWSIILLLLSINFAKCQSNQSSNLPSPLKSITMSIVSAGHPTWFLTSASATHHTTTATHRCTPKVLQEKNL